MSSWDAPNAFTSRGRATTPEAKREVIERVLEAWMKAPEMRLGQLIGNAVRGDQPVYYLEDQPLVEELAAFSECYAAHRARRRPESGTRVTTSWQRTQTRRQRREVVSALG